MSATLTNNQIAQTFPLIEEITDKSLKQGVYEIIKEIAQEMKWDSFHDIPKNLDHERNRSLVVHINGVTEIALSMAEMYKRTQNLNFNKDLLLASCLLHDISKPVECEPDTSVKKNTTSPVLPAKKSEIGNFMPHASYAAHKVLEKKLGLELAHIVTTHTHASNVRGMGWEAAILFYADFVDSDAGITLAGEGAKLFMQRWKL